LREHNKVCLHLYRFNHFWKNYFGFKYILHPLGIQLCAYVAFVASTNTAGRLIFFSGCLFQFICLTSDCLSASIVHKKAHSCYSLLNRISLDKRLSLHVKIKLNNYIQRLDGKKLSFTCFNLLNVTNTTYFYVSQSISSKMKLFEYFIKFLDIFLRSSSYLKLPHILLFF